MDYNHTTEVNLHDSRWCMAGVWRSKSQHHSESYVREIDCKFQEIRNHLKSVHPWSHSQWILGGSCWISLRLLRGFGLRKWRNRSSAEFLSRLTFWLRGLFIRFAWLVLIYEWFYTFYASNNKIQFYEMKHKLFMMKRENGLIKMKKTIMPLLSVVLKVKKTDQLESECLLRWDHLVYLFIY